jgi:hypothetical protein
MLSSFGRKATGPKFHFMFSSDLKKASAISGSLSRTGLRFAAARFWKK